MMLPPVPEIRKELEAAADDSRAEILQRYFKTGPGEYAEGDLFLGVRVPEVRKVAQRYRGLELDRVCALLRSPVHEERFLALVILTKRYAKAGEGERRQLFDAYVGHLEFVNHWDLVDTSAMHVVGAHLYGRSRGLLFELAGSDRMWSRRVAIISTYYFIKRDDFGDTLRLAEVLLGDPHDLMHKAVGWMLREVGKRDREAAEEFLRQFYGVMPRTMLRYAIERFPEGLRQAYLKGRI